MGLSRKHNAESGLAVKPRRARSEACICCVAYKDVGEGREHMYRTYGSRAMHGAIAEERKLCEP